MPKAFFLTAATLCKKPGETRDGKVTKAAVLDHKKPGDIADVSDEDFDHLLANGAIRKPTSDELKLASTREPSNRGPSAAQLTAAEKAVADAQAKVTAADGDDAALTAAKAELTDAEAELARLKA